MQKIYLDVGTPDGKTDKNTFTVLDDGKIVKNDGNPFASQASAQTQITFVNNRSNRLSGYTVVEVEGGWALQPPSN